MLQEYGEKRDFSHTPEPPPEQAGADEGPLTFVVQKHAARRLHYDFRLELDGVLKSWSVPKGPSLDPAEKRLAVMVEDHPLDYATFEGVIPKGQYGAGPVIVWDSGSYSPDEDGRLSFHDRAEASRRLRQALDKGKLSISLRGRKLVGSWTLVRTARGDGKDWLLIKHRDQFVDPSRDVLEEDRSVLSGLTIQDLKAGRRPPSASPSTAAVPILSSTPGARPAPLPERPHPMLATLVPRPFSHPDWLFEPKLDGVRLLASIREGRVTLLSRRGNDVSEQYPLIAAALAAQPEPDLLLDGEVVAPDERGVPSFHRLQQRLNLSREADIRNADVAIPVEYCVFDILHLSGHDLGAVPLERRKALLRQILLPSDRIRLLDHVDGEGEAAYSAALELGLEGIVAKRRDSPYEYGKRARSWLKVKAVQSEEFVIGGFSQGLGHRADSFGALLLGYFQGDKLVYVGHVGSGFDDATLASLRKRLDAIGSEVCPFSEQPPLKTAATWLQPELVAEVKFSQWTPERRLRAPVFLRLREDRDPRLIVRPQQPRAAAPKSQSLPRPSPSASDEVADLLERLQNPKQEFTVTVQGHRISLSNLDKEFWPALPGGRPPLSKRDFIAYLARVSPYILPHMKDRPITLTRYPEGIQGEHFYQKHWEQNRPPFLHTVRLFSSHNEGDVEYIVVNNLPTLVWLGQLADLELHTWFSRTDPMPDAAHLSTTFTGSGEKIDASVLNYPDFIVFDLDPYLYAGTEAPGGEPELHRRGFSKTCEVARHLKQLLDQLSLSAFLKTSGRTGLHVYVPVLRQYDYDVLRKAAETIGLFLLRRYPRDVTLEWAVEKRTGKVFLDYNQNARGKTLASVYSPRPLPEATVSMPLAWDELDKVYPTDFTIVTAPERLAQVGDLWAGILDAKHDLKALLEMADEGPGAA